MNIFVREHGQVPAGRNRLEQKLQKRRAQLRRYDVCLPQARWSAHGLGSVSHNERNPAASPDY
jgi:hypothetical protein